MSYPDRQVHDEREMYAGNTVLARPASSTADVTGDGPREVALALAGLNIAAMTPIEAINVLFSLQQHALAVLRGSRP